MAACADRGGELRAAVWRLPGGLPGVPVSLKTWAAVARNRLILTLLLVTTLQIAGQFAVFTYFGPLLARLTSAGADAIGLVFAIYGVCGFIGNMIASRISTASAPIGLR